MPAELQVTYTSVFIVITATICVTSAVRVPGGFYDTEIVHEHLKGEAVIAKTKEYHTFVICVAISLALCIGVAAVHTMVETLDDVIWEYVVLFTKIASWTAGMLGGIAIMQFVLVSLGDQHDMKSLVQGLFYGIVCTFYSGAILLRVLKPKT